MRLFLSYCMNVNPQTVQTGTNKQADLKQLPKQTPAHSSQGRLWGRAHYGITQTSTSIDFH